MKRPFLSHSTREISHLSENLPYRTVFTVKHACLLKEQLQDTNTEMLECMLQQVSLATFINLRLSGQIKSR